MKALIVGRFGHKTASGWGLSLGSLRDMTGAMLVVTALASIAAGQAVPLQGTRIFAVPLQPATVVATGATGDTTPATPAAAEPSAPAAAVADPAAARIAKIKQLRFDRRPSVLLGGEAPDGDAAAASGDASAVPVIERVITSAGSIATATIRIVPATPAAGSTAIVTAAPASESPSTPPTATDATGPSAAAGPTAPTAPPDPFDTELKGFRDDVLAGAWERVATFLATLKPAESTAALERILDQFATPPQPPPSPMGLPLEPELPLFSAADVIGLARLLPKPIGEPHRRQLGAIARMALAAGTEGNDLTAALSAELRREGTGLDLAAAAGILTDAGRADLADPLLPSLAEATAGKNVTVLELRVKQLRAARQRDPKAATLADVWQGVEALVSAAATGTPARRFAIEQAAELLPQLPKTDAAAWIGRITQAEPETGVELVSAIAARVAAGPTRDPHEVEPRTTWLRLLERAVSGVTATTAADDPRWRARLGLAARAWTVEARLSAQHDTRDVGMRRDPYGNIFYWEEQQVEMSRQRMPQWPVKLADMLETRPDDAWLARLDPAERPAVERAVVTLYAKMGDAEKALPALERLAQTHPEAARTLVTPLLAGWKLAHDPNDERTRRRPFFYGFGMDERQGGIPLSRSLQERNLAELEGIVTRLRALPVGPLDERVLVDCFTTCHSAAEVWQPEAIARVFGPIEQLSPTAVALLAERMRSNLAGTWQQPSVQEMQKTKRREADIRAEVEKGYATARAFVAGALARYPGHWALTGAEAAIAHDDNDFQRKISDSPDFTKNRRAALDRFAAAGKAYAAATATLPRDEWSSDLLDRWFLAGCGACDAKRIDETTEAVAGESAKVQAVIESMEGEARQWHRERFATALVSRLAQVNPAVKHRIVREGLAVVGDEPKARDAKQVFEYYSDLVREIELRADIDGPDRVGTGRPFGVLVTLRHTREIEREAGGFGRYLQNQKTNTMFSFNFGRPLENYRDKFEEMVRRTLGEFFEVKSVTFQSEDVQSRADAEYGWRRTPYAYLVLAAKDAKVDKLPPLRLDLDFLDTAGHVILPIESRAVGLDAAKAADPRPFAKLALTEILDERKARAGELNLEIRASARGLVPDLPTILDAAPAGYEIKGIRDDGLSVARFDPDSTEPVVLSERSWLVNLVPGANADGRFVFPEPKVAVAEKTLQRYDDADLVAAEPTVTVGRRLQGHFLTWPRVAAGVAGLVGLLALGALLRAWVERPPVSVESFVVPDPPTPFAVLQLLRDIESNNGLDARGHAQLRESIERIETGYFAGGDAPQASDLEQMARSWVSRARPRRKATSGGGAR